MPRRGNFHVALQTSGMMRSGAIKISPRDSSARPPSIRSPQETILARRSRQRRGSPLVASFPHDAFRERSRTRGSQSANYSQFVDQRGAGLSSGFCQDLAKFCFQGTAVVRRSLLQGLKDDIIDAADKDLSQLRIL